MSKIFSLLLMIEFLIATKKLIWFFFEIFFLLLIQMNSNKDNQLQLMNLVDCCMLVEMQNRKTKQSKTKKYKQNLKMLISTLLWIQFQKYWVLEKTIKKITKGWKEWQNFISQERKFPKISYYLDQIGIYLRKIFSKILLRKKSDLSILTRNFKLFLGFP